MAISFDDRLAVEVANLRAERVRLSAEVTTLRQELDRRIVITDAAIRWFVNGDRSEEVAIAPEQVRSDSNPDWVEGMLASPRRDDPEFEAFRIFTDPKSLVLDIGANFGYSVPALMVVGCGASILSFEPNPDHWVCLQRIRQLRPPGSYDYVGAGLGDGPATLNFTVGVINGVPMSALSSANPKENLRWLVNYNYIQHAQAHHANDEGFDFRFVEQKWQVVTLDAVLAERRFAVPTDRIVGAKIDVEGFEGPAIAGGMKILAEHRPLIMIEQANRDEHATTLLTSLGYIYADWVEGRMMPIKGQSTRTNGLFFHSDLALEYRAKGIL